VDGRADFGAPELPLAPPGSDTCFSPSKDNVIYLA
jgi:hypothetical protein